MKRATIILIIYIALIYVYGVMPATILMAFWIIIVNVCSDN